ncbi:MAG: twin-arginine translocation pathway signal [Rhodobacterales bacterium]|nr:MAG: twin-arginine translocation pathway signal [Rhodobacterales bacterium]
MKVSRRRFLSRSVALGCTAAASPLLTPVTFASAPWDNRLVVIILRGGMDGLGVVQPRGAAEYAALRKPGDAVGAPGGPHDLDGFFALHPGLSTLMPLWAAGELGFVHAVSTPYRDKRSHFDGQDVLEAGTTNEHDPVRDGWLNRMLQVLPGVSAETAYAVGRSDMLLTRGAAPVANWSPDARVDGLSPQAIELLQLVVHDDPLVAPALNEALNLSAQSPMADMAGAGAGAGGNNMIETMIQEMQAARKSGGHKQIAEFAAKKLRQDSRIASFSINGWDTHANQGRTLVRPLEILAEMVLTLKENMRGPVWGKTTVIAMTEFGRTARLNGTGGTDHGTGGLMMLAGGALRGGRVLGQWPGLAEADLYDRRDLMPTSDLRAYAGWAMRGLFGIDRSVIERSIFPGVDLGDDPGLLL